MRTTLSNEDVRLIGASIRELSTATEKLVQLATSSPPPSHSAAARHGASKFNLATLGTSTAVNDAHMAILFATIAGADHVRAYLSLLPTSRANIAMATLTRASIEAFAKTGYLLAPAESRVFIGRYIDVTKNELIHPLRHSRFQDHAGVEIDKIGYSNRLQEIRAALQPAPAQAVKMKEQVDLLLKSALAEDSDVELIVANIYSQLSGAAHAGTTAIGMYVGADREPTRLLYPRQVACEHVGYLFAATARVGELAIDHFAVSGAPLERWQGALFRASDALNHLVGSK